MDLQQDLKGMDQCLSRRREQLYRQILTNASKGLAFSQDVMWERGPDNIQYSKADYSWLFCASGLLAPITRSKSRKRRGTKSLSHNTRLRGYVASHLPVLPPLQIVHHPSMTIDKTYGHHGRLESISSYQIPTMLEEKKQYMDNNNGDESVERKLTKDTLQQIPRNISYKARLKPLLHDHSMSASITDLTYSDHDESNDKEDFCGFYSKPEASTKSTALQCREPETPLPVYYRIHGNSVSPVHKDEEGGINRTANDVAVNHMEPPKTPCLLDSLNPPAGKYVYNTAYNFEFKLHTGTAKQVDTSSKENQDCIINSSGTGKDGWVATQCLALEGEASQAVIERLLSQLFLSNVPSDQEQAAALLTNISSKTILVQSLLGERLNCPNWRNRVLACKTMSKLKSPINKDLTNKLLYLMWNDWSSWVRQAAAQTLGKLGLGSAIHNELSVKLHKGPTPWRVEALILIGQLKLMTTKLLPSFLHCLSDEFDVVRKQACLAAASLMIKNETIQNKLFDLMQNDLSCDVKVAAINALGRISRPTPTLQGLLLWALRHEEDPSVRIAACDALNTLEATGPELQNPLQECYALESNAQVQRHMEDLMRHWGYSLDRDRSMGQIITEQVKKFCTKSNITEKLLQLEDSKPQMQRKSPKRKLARTDHPVSCSAR